MTRATLPLPPPFDELLRRHEREILRYLLRLSGNHADAADLFQETWLRAYRAYPRLKPGSEIRAWLYSIAANLCRNRARDGARRRRVIAEREQRGSAAGSRGAVRLGGENDGFAAIHLRQLLAKLPARQREAVQLRYFAGLDYAEIAALMESSQENARANVSHGMKKLQAMWGSP
jgi:RNA polymerase sigma-70 factor (ECF subfamily)